MALFKRVLSWERCFGRREVKNNNENKDGVREGRHDVLEKFALNWFVLSIFKPWFKHFS